MSTESNMPNVWVKPFLQFYGAHKDWVPRLQLTCFFALVSLVGSARKGCLSLSDCSLWKLLRSVDLWSPRQQHPVKSDKPWASDVCMEIPLKRQDSNPGHNNMATASRCYTRALRMPEQLKTEESYWRRALGHKFKPRSRRRFFGLFHLWILAIM